MFQARQSASHTYLPPNIGISNRGECIGKVVPVLYERPIYFHPRYATIFYIDVLHTYAIESLTSATATTYDQLSMSDVNEAKFIAKAILTFYGCTWPPIFDQPFPAESREAGVIYDIVYREYATFKFVPESK